MKKMSKMDIEAKKDVLKELLQEMTGLMREKNKNGIEEMRKMKKVSVMAPDKEGLEEGLEKAQELVHKGPDMDEESPEEHEEEMDEDMDEEEMSDEDKKQLLKKMMK